MFCVLRFTFSVLRSTFYVLRFTFGVLRLAFYVLRFMFCVLRSAFYVWPTFTSVTVGKRFTFYVMNFGPLRFDFLRYWMKLVDFREILSVLSSISSKIS
jgi:hypothetical protein